MVTSGVVCTVLSLSAASLPVVARATNNGAGCAPGGLPSEVDVERLASRGGWGGLAAWGDGAPQDRVELRDPSL
ncbi:hypothetical protein GCM10010234_61610 [Streptomyces hawaiiensis]